MHNQGNKLKSKIIMKLFLTSIGIIPEIESEFIKLLGKAPQDTKLVFISTASNIEPDTSYVKEDKENLARLGFTNIPEVDLAKETISSLPEKLKDAGIIFVEGGNTFYLLKHVRESGFALALRPFLERGGVYVGVSAGSIIAGPNIESAGWKYADINTVDLTDLAALALVPFAVTPHYCPQVAQAVTESAAKVGYPVIALTDRQAILVNEGKAQIIGPGEKITFNSPEIWRSKEYEGVIIEESLADNEVMKKIRIVSTKIEKVTANHQTPWLPQWTLHTVLINENEAPDIAAQISKSLDKAHGEWYADFKNETHHYIIFSDKVFFIDRADRSQYDQAKAHGIALGIPEHQVDFDIFYIPNKKAN